MTGLPMEKTGLVAVALWLLPVICFLVRHRVVRSFFSDAWKCLKKHPPIMRCAVILLAIAIFMYGGTKSGRLSAPRRVSVPEFVFSENQLRTHMVLARVVTNEVHSFAPPSTASIHAPWRVRGAANDSFALEPESWSFPYGTSMVHRLIVTSRGSVFLGDTSGPELAVFGTSLGIVPAVRWGFLAQPSRVWSEVTVSNSVLITWENALYLRDPVRLVSFQAEFFSYGDCITRYALGTAWPSDARIGFWNDGFAEWFRSAASSPPPTTLYWKQIPYNATATSDDDGDGRTSAEEVLWTHTDPFDPDEDGDLIPDGFTAARWSSHPLQADVAGYTNLIVRVLSAPANGGNATLIMGGLPIILSTPRDIPLAIPDAEVIPFTLAAPRGQSGPLALTFLTPATMMRRANPENPWWLYDPNGIFSATPCAGGSGALARPHFALIPEPYTDSRCLHGIERSLDFRPEIYPPECGFNWDALTCFGFTRTDADRLRLTVPDGQTIAYGEVTLGAPFLAQDSLTRTESIHLCQAGATFCYACGFAHPIGTYGDCWHEPTCPARTSLTADCTCPPLWIPINLDDDNIDGLEDRTMSTTQFPYDDEILEVNPIGEIRECCCFYEINAPSILAHATSDTLRTTSDIPSNILYLEGLGPTETFDSGDFAYDILPATGGIYRTLHRPYGAGNTRILADATRDDIIDAHDTSTLAYSSCLFLARSSEPCLFRFYNEAPTNATLRLILSNSASSPILLETPNGPAQPNTLFLLPNSSTNLWLDTSGTNSFATLTYSLLDPSNAIRIAHSIPIAIIDTTIPDRYEPYHPTQSIHYDLPPAPAGAIWSLHLPNDPIPIASGSTYATSLNLPPALLPNTYELHVAFSGLYCHGDPYTHVTSQLHIARCDIAQSDYGIQVGPNTSRICVSLAPSNNCDRVQWELLNPAPQGPKLHDSIDSEISTHTLLAGTNIWVSSGLLHGDYTLQATWPSNTNEYSCTTLHAIDFNLSHTRLVMREAAAPTNVLEALSSDSATACWSLEQDARWTTNATASYAYSATSLFDTTLNNANKPWISPGDAQASYTLTATHDTYSNITASCTLDVAQINLEPITTYFVTNYVIRNGQPVCVTNICNPASICITNSGIFRIDVSFPERIPDSQITWSGNNTQFLDGNTGRTVVVQPTLPGTHTNTLSIAIQDFVGPPPEISYTSDQEISLIPVHFYFLCDREGTYPRTVDSPQSFSNYWINEANILYKQACINFYAGSIQVITNKSLFSIDRLDPEIGKIVDMFMHLDVQVDGVKAYIIDCFKEGNEVIYNACTLATDSIESPTFGMIIPSWLPPNAFAHELGHSLGMDDIYCTFEGLNQDLYEQISAITDNLEKVHVPYDWTGIESYYSPNKKHAGIIKSILMNGFVDSNDKLILDIPMGDVIGLTSSSIDPVLCPVGIHHLIRNPITYGSNNME